MSVNAEHRVALIRINRLYRLGMDGERLYQATRKWRVVDPNRGAEWAFALYQGKVKGVFKIDGWEQDPDGSGRWGFYGERSPEMERTYFAHGRFPLLHTRREESHPVRQLLTVAFRTEL